MLSGSVVSTWLGTLLPRARKSLFSVMLGCPDGWRHDAEGGFRWAAGSGRFRTAGEFFPGDVWSLFVLNRPSRKDYDAPTHDVGSGVSTQARRSLIALVVRCGISIRRVSVLLSVARSALGYESRQVVKDAPVEVLLRRLAQRHP